MADKSFVRLFGFVEDGEAQEEDPVVYLRILQVDILTTA